MNLFKKFATVITLFAAVSSLALTSCSKDDDDDYPKEIAGTYVGEFTSLMPGMEKTDAEILLEKSGDKLKLSLTKSAFDGLLQGAKIVVDNIDVKKEGAIYKYQGDIFVPINNVQIPVSIVGEGVPSAMTIVVSVTLDPSQPTNKMVFTFKGARK